MKKFKNDYITTHYINLIIKLAVFMNPYCTMHKEDIINFCVD